MVKVDTILYADIFKNYNTISVPEYQRPYRWDVGKVDELLCDLEEFFITNAKPNLEYYIGSVLFYDNINEQKKEIIDGQQRLTTLVLIEYAINNCLQPNQNLNYNSHLSFINIQEVSNFLKGKTTLLNELNKLNFLDKIRLTIIISESEDNAFAFFDSQNNRGVSLGADDYLKAYHLRAVASESLQAVLAQQWEEVTFNSHRANKYEEGLLHLFYKILYRSRQWKGQSTIEPETKDGILKAFQKRTYKSNSETKYKLFASRNNIKYTSISIESDDSNVLNVNEELKGKDTNLPFSLRQPLYKGHNFFQFTQKYHAIHQLLFSNQENIPEVIGDLRNYYDKIYNNNMSVFLKHYMQLCLVMYYDVFGEEQLIKAIQYFDYFIGSIRVKKYYVRKEAIKNSLIDSSNNLLDVVTQAYLPEEIFEFIGTQSNINNIYLSEKLKKDDGVRNSYKTRVLGYYQMLKEESLKNRLLWIK